MAGLGEANTTEIDPNTTTPLLALASCPVDGRPGGSPRLTGKMKIRVSRGSLAFDAYKKTSVEEAFACNYELNPAYRKPLEKAGIEVSGVSEDGGARIIELSDHRFFLGTGFLPQLASEAGNPHPLFVAFLEAAGKTRK